MTVFKIKITEFPVNEIQCDDSKCSQLVLRWLGQAGFQIFYKKHHLMIDPYLSNFLAKKYAEKEFPHMRMMSSPLRISEVEDLNFVLCTHRHSDHMDPESLPELLKKNHVCKLIAPVAERRQVEQIGIDFDRALFANAADTIKLNSDIKLEVIPSAHEDIKIDKHGSHHYLGYVLRIGKFSVYHSGDCVLYHGLIENLKNKDIDIALLPINGRDKYRKSKGVPGNFTFEEAIELCQNTKIPNMICHHFGMFNFNTVDVEKLKATIERMEKKIQVFFPDINKVFVVSDNNQETE